MTDLTPVSELTPVVQLETNTLALGGTGSPMNQQAQALLNRTQYIADQINTIDTFQEEIQDQADPAKGTSFVGWLRGVVGAVGAKLSAFLSWGDVHAFEFLTVSEIIAVRAGTAGDMRARLQLAIDSAVGKTFRLNAGLWQMTPLPNGNPTVGLCLDVPSDIRIVFDAGAKIELTAHDHTIYQMFRVWGRENVAIEGAVLDGRKDLNASATGEFGMGIDIRSSKRVHLIRPVTKNMWGDGIYLGQQADVVSEDIVIDSHLADGCRRQGMSLVSCAYLTVNSPEWKNISGTNPSAGLDIEPNGNNNLLIGIRINNPRTNNCAGMGIKIDLALLVDGVSPVAQYVDIVINGHVDYGSAVGAGVFRAGVAAAIQGEIVFNDPVWKHSSANAFVSEDWASIGPAVQLNRPKALNPNRSGQTSPVLGSAFVCHRQAGSGMSTYAIGNLTIQEPSVRLRSGSIAALYAAQDAINGPTFIEKVHFLNPVEITGVTGTGLRGYHFGGGTFSDDLRTWSYPIAGSSTLNGSTAANPVLAPTTSATFTLGTGSFQVNSPDVIVRAPAGHTGNLAVVGPANSFVGLGAGAIGLQATAKPHAYLRVRPLGNDKYIVIERVGLWVEV